MQYSRRRTVRPVFEFDLDRLAIDRKPQRAQIGWPWEREPAGELLAQVGEQEAGRAVHMDFHIRAPRAKRR